MKVAGPIFLRGFKNWQSVAIAALVGASLAATVALGVLAVAGGRTATGLCEALDALYTLPGGVAGGASCTRALGHLAWITAFLAGLGAVSTAMQVAAGRSFTIGLPARLRELSLPVGLQVVLGLSLLALLLRLPGLGRGLWRDEASSYFNSLLADQAAFWDRLVYSELNPPLYYLIQHYWQAAVSIDDGTMKLPALVFGILLVPTCFALGRVIGGTTAGAAAATLVALSPQAVYYAQEARPYTVATVLGGVALAFLLEAMRRDRPTFWAAYAVAAALLLYTHYTGFVVLGAAGLGACAVLWLTGASRRTWYALILANAAVFLLYLPWLPTFFDHFSVGTPWSRQSGLLDKAELIVRNLGYANPIGDGPWVLATFAGFLLLLVAGLGMRCLLRWLEYRARPSVDELAPLLCGVMVVLGASILGIMGYSGRHMHLFLPAACALVGLVIAWWLRSLAADRTLRAHTLFVACCAWVVLNGWTVASASRVPKSGVRPLVAESTPETLERTYFVLSPDFLAPTFAFYTRDAEVDFLGFARMEEPEIFSPRGYAEIWRDPGAIDEALRRIETAMGTHDRLGFVTSGCGRPPNDRGEMAYSRSNELLEELRTRYSLRETRTYQGTGECLSYHVFHPVPSVASD